MNPFFTDPKTLTSALAIVVSIFGAKIGLDPAAQSQIVTALAFLVGAIAVHQHGQATAGVSGSAIVLDSAHSVETLTTDEKTTLKGLIPPVLAAKIGLVMLAAFSLVACASPIPASAPTSGTQATRGGDASGEQKATDTGVATAASYAGGAKASNVKTAATRTVQSTAAGPSLMAFQLGAGSQAMADALKNDPIIAMISAQSKPLLDAYIKTPTPEIATQLAALRKEAADRMAVIGASVAGSLPSLKNVITINVIRGWATGAVTPELTDAEAKAEADGITALSQALGPLFADTIVPTSVKDIVVGK